MAVASCQARTVSVSSHPGRLDRSLQEVLRQFEAFDGASSARVEEWKQELIAIQNRQGPQRVALVHGNTDSRISQDDLVRGLRGVAPLDVSLANALQRVNGRRSWPEGLIAQDWLLYALDAPLMASDLLWLQELPDDCQAWLLVQCRPGDALDDVQADLGEQLPELWRAGCCSERSG